MGRADLPAELWPLCDIVAPNETELAILTQQPISESLNAEEVRTNLDP